MIRKRILIGTTLLALVIAMLFLDQTAVGSGKELSPKSKDTSRGALASLDRGNTRTEYSVNLLSETVSSQSTTFDASTEIDITSATISTYIFEVDTCLANVYLGQPGFVYPLNVAVKESGVQHLTFDPPIRARAGDAINVDRLQPVVGDIRVEVSLFGTVPAPTKSDLMYAH
ncbi:hypothetical protein KQI84_07625 [bacterium]|nr:hypothetical protein [bacterium]